MIYGYMGLGAKSSESRSGRSSGLIFAGCGSLPMPIPPPLSWLTPKPKLDLECADAAAAEPWSIEDGAPGVAWLAGL